MRKVTEQVAKAFNDGINIKRDNTEVETTYHTVENSVQTVITMRLHSNQIASMIKTPDSKIVVINDCGWCTPTTRERLNGLLETLGHSYRLSIKKGCWYIDGAYWDGSNFQLTIRS